MEFIDTPSESELPMPPHLIVEQGRIKDAKFALTPDRSLWRIGRQKDCEIWLPDDSPKPEVSRRHAVIACVDGKYYIKDGDGDRAKSHNRTKVNREFVDLPSRKLLKHHDVIEICSYVLTFHDGVPLPDQDSPSTVMLAPADASDDGDSSDMQPADKFKEIVELLRHSFELDGLLARVVESLLKTFKRAERSFVILVDEKTGKADRIQDFKTRTPEVGAPRPYSQKIVDQCLLAKQAQRNSDPAVGRRNLCAPVAVGQGGSVRRSAARYAVQDGTFPRTTSGCSKPTPTMFLLLSRMPNITRLRLNSRNASGTWPWPPRWSRASSRNGCR